MDLNEVRTTHADQTPQRLPADVATQYRRSVQVNLLRHTDESGVEIYLQQRHKDLKSFPEKWVCPGGVVDGLQNFSKDELHQFTSALEQPAVLASKEHDEQLIEALAVRFYDGKELRVFSESLNRSVVADAETKRQLLRTLVSDVQREFAILPETEQKALIYHAQAVLKLIYIATAKKEVEEEAGISLIDFPSSSFVFQRVAMSEQTRPSRHNAELNELTIYEFPVLLIDVTGLPNPRYDHDAQTRLEHNLAPRHEAQDDGWFSLETAQNMGDRLPPQMAETVKMLRLVLQLDPNMSISDLLQRLRI